MKVNGYKLQQAIRELQERREVLEARFSQSHYAFPGEEAEKGDPEKIMEEINALEARIAEVQVAQARFNLTVQVDVDGRKMTLLEAVKAVGGAGRIANQWRALAKGNESARGFFGNDLTRDRDAIVAKRQITQDRASELARKASKYARALREAIQQGNAQSIELDVSIDLE